MLRQRISELATDTNLLMHGLGPLTAENVEAAVHSLDIAELLLERAASACDGLEATP